MSLIGHIIWSVFGGFIIFLEYMLSGFILCSTIGIPFGIQCFKIGFNSITPFGLKIYDRKPGISGGCITRIFNVVWIFLGGIWIALTDFGFGPLFCITIIGIPFGNRHFKLMSLSFASFRKRLSE